MRIKKSFHGCTSRTKMAQRLRDIERASACALMGAWTNTFTCACLLCLLARVWVCGGRAGKGVVCENELTNDNWNSVAKERESETVTTVSGLKTHKNVWPTSVALPSTKATISNKKKTFSEFSHAHTHTAWPNVEAMNISSSTHWYIVNLKDGYIHDKIHMLCPHGCSTP